MRPVVCMILLASLLTGRVLNAAEDTALTPPVINTVPDSKYGDGTRLFQGIPGLERAANGRLWALWYAGGPDEPGEGPGNYVVLVTSGDDGQTWSGPKLVIDPPGPVRAYDPCLWHSPDGRLWLFWAQSYQWWDGRSGVWAIVTEHSGDETPKWSAPRRLCNGIMMNKPTVLSTGEWLLPVSVWERPAEKRTDESHRHDLGTENGANVHVSRDKGATWSRLGQAKVPNRVFDEHMLIERRDGSLWMLVRAAYGIGESTSSDRGKTWSAGRESSIPHVNSRFFVRRLNSGKLLLVTHEPPDKKTRSHLVAHLSDDDGRTWTGGLLIDDRKGISYPDGVQTPDGTIYLIYDFSRTGEKQILMATFTETDIATGQWSSSKARQRVLVNQATGQRPKAAAPKEADKPKIDAKKSASDDVLAHARPKPAEAVKASALKADGKFAFGTVEVPSGFTHVAPRTKYDAQHSFGFLRIAEMPSQTSVFAVDVDEGNYDVTIRFGDADSATSIVIKVESRRLGTDAAAVLRAGSRCFEPGGVGLGALFV